MIFPSLRVTLSGTWGWTGDFPWDVPAMATQSCYVQRRNRRTSTCEARLTLWLVYWVLTQKVWDKLLDFLLDLGWVFYSQTHLYVFRDSAQRHPGCSWHPLKVPSSLEHAELHKNPRKGSGTLFQCAPLDGMYGTGFSTWARTITVHRGKFLISFPCFASLFDYQLCMQGTTDLRLSILNSAGQK